jgi:hypothetical protein
VEVCCPTLQDAEDKHQSLPFVEFVPTMLEIVDHVLKAGEDEVWCLSVSNLH